MNESQEHNWVKLEIIKYDILFKKDLKTVKTR